MKDSADAEVVRRLLARDQETLREVIAQYGGAVYGMARRIVGEPTLAEEVAQDVFLALWRRPGAYDPERGSLQAFLAGVARNKGVDLVRREQALRRTRESLLSEAQSVLNESSVHEETNGIDRRLAVLDALGRLTPVQREAVILAYFGGRTYREVAQELNIPEGTAKTRLRDGLNKLRELMSKHQEEA